MKHYIIIPLLLLCMNIMGQETRVVATEIIHLHTDNDSYAIGDTVRFNADLIDGETGQMSTDRDYPAGRSNFIYLELHDAQSDTLVVRYMVKKDSVGNFANAFVLPLRLNSGHYTLVAYTRYMMNFSNDFFAYKDLYVQGIKNSESTLEHKATLPLSVVVRPEGGVLLRDHMQCIAYSVRDANGIGIEAEVCITNTANDSIIAQGETEVDGMGGLYFVPESGLISSYDSKKAITFGDSGFAVLDTSQLPKGLIKIQIRNKATQETMAERIFYQR